VEIVAEGDATAVERLSRWAREGSVHARVTGVEATTEVPEGLAAFRTL
jgi:acylphosphatase